MAFIYNYDSLNETWGVKQDINDDYFIENTILSNSDYNYNDKFGYSVSVSGDYFIVGAYNKDNKGAAYIYEYNNGWEEDLKTTWSPGGSSTINYDIYHESCISCR